MFFSGYQLTGFGKSLCYEVLPFVMDDKLGRHGSIVIVISPLVSLMVDQVQSLRQRSVNAAIIGIVRHYVHTSIS